MSDAKPTEPYPTEVLAPASAPVSNGGGTDAGAPPTPKRRRRGRGWLIALAVVVLLALGLVIAELIVRAQVEERISSEVEQQLPTGVTGEVTAGLGGFSVLAQLAGGRFDEVRLEAPALAVQGREMAVDVVAYGFPLDEGGRIGHIEGTLVAGADVLDAFVPTPGDGAFELGDGVVSYGDSTEFLGQEIGYTVTAKPSAAGTQILLAPQSVEVTWGGASLDLGGAVDRFVGEDPIPVCVAEVLPAGVGVRFVGVTPEAVTIRLEASDLPLDREALETTGSCA